MRLLKAVFKQIQMFEGQTLALDFYAQDKVPSTDGSAYCLGRPIYTNTVIAVAGINATGKTTVLRLLSFAIRVACGQPLVSAMDGKDLLLRMSSGLKLDLVFEQSGQLYVLRSEIAPSHSSRAASQSGGLEFCDETLYCWRGKKMPKKSLLSSVDLLLENCVVKTQRSKLSQSERSFLSSAISIATSVTNKDTRCVYQSAFDERDGANLWFEGAEQTLRVLDSSIDYLERGEDGNSCVIGFAAGGPVHTSRRGLESVLSSGTIKGLRFVENAVLVLSDGGYLLVDEIENHLNKQLVSVLVDLFQSPDTNPHGAVIVFTTHYPEVLDRVHRKDNVYFLTRGGGSRLSEVVKYSDRVGRIENKKSEVFLSNYVGGTAPNYTDVQALRSLIKEAVARAGE